MRPLGVRWVNSDGFSGDCGNLKTRNLWGRAEPVKVCLEKSLVESRSRDQASRWITNADNMAQVLSLPSKMSASRHLVFRLAKHKKNANIVVDSY